MCIAECIISSHRRETCSLFTFLKSANIYVTTVANTYFWIVAVISGMMVQDPRKPKDVDALFEQARQSAVDRPVEPSSRSASTSFTGAARLLSGETVSSSPQQQQQDQPQVVMHTITFWRNGFTVDDGPLRRFDDPENKAFMEVFSKRRTQTGI